MVAVHQILQMLFEVLFVHVKIQSTATAEATGNPRRPAPAWYGPGACWPRYLFGSNRNSLTNPTFLLSMSVNKAYSGIVPADPERCPGAEVLEDTQRFMTAMRKAGRHIQSRAAGAASE